MGAQAQDGLEEIIVTGSRVPVTQGMAEPTPVTVVTPEDLQAFNAGATTVEQLGQLPQFFNTFSSQRGSGTLFGEAGGSYLDLRALGRQRTLVLLDGSRLPPADKRGAVNVDWLPASALLSSVDVVTGGASAAYGADALGGVVNYRINREFHVPTVCGAAKFQNTRNHFIEYSLTLGVFVTRVQRRKLY